MGFSSPCIGTPGGFEQGGMKSVSSGSNSSHADINSISSSIQPHSQGSLPQSNLALYMDTHLIWTPRYYKQFANCLWE